MTAITPDVAEAPARPTQTGEVIYRHRLLIRIAHWLNVVCITVLLMSGLNIFNAHPRLYWGMYGADARPDPAVFQIGAEEHPKGVYHGVTQIGSLRIPTTGVLGVSKVNGHDQFRAWPAWLTAPSFTDLADARHWHFFFAWFFVLNGLVYLAYSFVIRHVQRDLWPTLQDLRGIGRSIVDHIKLKHPTGEDAKRYNVLQRLAYLTVVFVLLPGMVLTGLTMSPGFNAIAPPLLALFGGRQSARTLHFIFAWSIVGFVVIHVVEVFLAGVVNEITSMITGYYKVPPAEHGHD